MKKQYKFLQSQITQYIYTLLHCIFDSKSLTDLIQSNMQQFSFAIKLIHNKVTEKPFNHLTWLVASESFIAVTLRASSYISLSFGSMHKHFNPHN